jgi:hypothetical protein
MLAELARGHSTCKDTFFTTYNETVGCKVSPVGRNFIGIHYFFEILFLIILAVLFLYHGKKYNWYYSCGACINGIYILLPILFFPLFLLLLLFPSLMLIFFPHLLIRKWLHFRSFHLLNMGKRDTDRDSYTQRFQRDRVDNYNRDLLLFCLIVQLCTLIFENSLELFITVTLFVAGYVNIVSILFAIPTCINTAVRLVFLPFPIFDLIKQHCVNTCHALNEEIETEVVRPIHET